VVLGDSCKSWQGRITPAAQFSDKRVQDQLGMGQTEAEIHATPMPRRSHTKGQWHREIHVNPDIAEPHQRHSSLARVQDQLDRGQTEVEIHATAMPRPEGVTPRARALGEQGRITSAAQFTDKGGTGLLV
jgi:hypothetical protein